MINTKDVQKAVAKHVKELVRQLTPDTLQEDVIEAIGVATETIHRGWFLPVNCPGVTIDQERHARACSVIIQSTPSWSVATTLYDSMMPEEMQVVAWEALRACLYQALADLGYDLHAEYPLAKVTYGPLTGHRMTAADFGDLCKAAYAADPVLDLVVKLSGWGLTESQVMNLLKTQPMLPGPFKNALCNKYRTFRLTSP